MRGCTEVKISYKITIILCFCFILIPCSIKFITLSSLFNDLDLSTSRSFVINIQFINQNLMGYMSIDPNYIPLFNLHLEAVIYKQQNSDILNPSSKAIYPKHIK